MQRTEIMGLIGGIARTAVIAGTATAVSNRVSRRQAHRWAEKDQQAAMQEAAYPPPQYLPPQYPVPRYPPPQYAPPQYAPAQYAPAQYAPPAPAQPLPPAPAAGDMSQKLAQLQQLADLRAQGILTDAEVEAQKAKILGS